MKKRLSLKPQFFGTGGVGRLLTFDLLKSATFYS